MGEIGRKVRTYAIEDVLSEPFKHFDYGLGVGGRTCAKRYAEGEIEIHAHFTARIEGASAVTHNLCAVARAGTERGSPKTETHIAKGAHVAPGPEPAAPTSEQRHVRQAVLVNAREFVELPEGVEAVLVPRQVIRLQILDDCLRTWGNVPDSPHGALSFVFADGEHESFFDICGQRVPPIVGDGEIVDKVVQGRAELVEAVAKDEADSGGRRPVRFGPKDVLASLRMVLVDDVVRVGSQPPLNFQFQALQVLKRPIQPDFVVEALASHTSGG